MSAPMAPAAPAASSANRMKRAKAVVKTPSQKKRPVSKRPKTRAMTHESMLADTNPILLQWIDPEHRVTFIGYSDGGSTTGIVIQQSITDISVTQNDTQLLITARPVMSDPLNIQYSGLIADTSEIDLAAFLRSGFDQNNNSYFSNSTILGVEPGIFGGVRPTHTYFLSSTPGPLQVTAQDPLGNPIYTVKTNTAGQTFPYFSLPAPLSANVNLSMDLRVDMNAQTSTNNTLAWEESVDLVTWVLINSAGWNAADYVQQITGTMHTGSMYWRIKFTTGAFIGQLSGNVFNFAAQTIFASNVYSDGLDVPLPDIDVLNSKCTAYRPIAMSTRLTYTGNDFVRGGQLVSAQRTGTDADLVLATAYSTLSPTAGVHPSTAVEGARVIYTPEGVADKVFSNMGDDRPFAPTGIITGTLAQTGQTYRVWQFSVWEVKTTALIFRPHKAIVCPKLYDDALTALSFMTSNGSGNYDHEEFIKDVEYYYQKAKPLMSGAWDVFKVAMPLVAGLLL